MKATPSGSLKDSYLSGGPADLSLGGLSPSGLAGSFALRRLVSLGVSGDFGVSGLGGVGGVDGVVGCVGVSGVVGWVGVSSGIG